MHMHRSQTVTRSAELAVAMVDLTQQFGAATREQLQAKGFTRAELDRLGDDARTAARRLMGGGR